MPNGKSLDQAMSASGEVVWTVPVRAPPTAPTAKEFVDLLLKHSTLSPDPHCTRLTVRGVTFDGPLILKGAGTEVQPILPFTLIDCCLAGGIDASHAYLQGLVLQNCCLSLAPPAIQQDRPLQIALAGATVYESLKIDGLLMPTDSILDFSHAHLKHSCLLRKIGTMASCSVCRQRIRQPRCISFAGATVQGSLRLESVWINAQRPRRDKRENADDKALNLQELTLAGSLFIGAAPKAGSRNANGGNGNPCSTILGELAMQSAHIQGDVMFRGVWMANEVRDGALDPPYALMAQNAKVDGSFLLWPDDEDGDRDCRLMGQANLNGMRIGGDLQVVGRYRAFDHTRVFNAKSIHVTGDIRFGWLTGAEDGKTRSRCEVIGEIDFTNANVGGKFVISGSTHSLKPNSMESIAKWLKTDGEHFAYSERSHNEKAMRRWCECAVKLKGATVKNNVLLEGTTGLRCCCIEGLILTGATIEGHLTVRGVTIEAVKKSKLDYKENFRKAISANGLTLKGGMSVEPYLYRFDKDGASLDENISQPDRAYSRIYGDIRLRNANISGPVIFTGVAMQDSCDDKDRSGTAFWASNTTFNSDLIFQSARPLVNGKTFVADGSAPGEPQDKESDGSVLGEMRLWGAKISGSLRLHGLKLRATTTGSALDASQAEVGKVLYLGQTPPGRLSTTGVGTDQPCVIRGLVNLNFVKAGMLIFGSDPPTNKAEMSCDCPPSLSMAGTLLLREAKISGPVILSEVFMQPSERIEADAGGKILASCAVRNAALARLKELSIFKQNCIISAVYTELGVRLFVRLRNAKGVASPEVGGKYKDEKSYSCGLINLYGARTGTIGALSAGDDKVQSSSPQPEVDEHWGSVPDQAGKQRSGNPKVEQFGKNRVGLNLDQFRYSRFSDKPESQTSSWKHRWLWLLGRPLPKNLSPRYSWMQQQVRNTGFPKEPVVWQYRQAARVYRDMGDLKRSYAYEKERRWLQIEYKTAPWLERQFDRLFGLCFGFGYSSTRALCSCLALVLVSWWVTICGVKSHRLGPANPPAVVAPPVVLNGEVQFLNPARNLGGRTIARHNGAEPELLRNGSGSFTGTLTSPAPPKSGPRFVVGELTYTNLMLDRTILTEALAASLPSAAFRGSLSFRFEPALKVKTRDLSNRWPPTQWHLRLAWQTPLFVFFYGLVQLLSWLIFPLAALTVSGVLQEKASSGSDDK